MFDIPLVPIVETTTKLYTKTFTQETWNKLDFPIPELGYSMTMQKFLESKYTIHIEEEKKKPTDTKTLSKSKQKQISKNNKKIKDEIFKKIQQLKEIEKKSWSQIRDELISQENSGQIPQMGYENQTPKNLSNAYGKWRVKQIG